MEFNKTPLNIAITIGLSAVMLAGCGSSSNTVVDTPARFSVAVADAGNGGGEMLIDATTGLTWINDTTLDTNRDGCVTPAATGPIPVATVNSRCNDQTYGGFNDWRGPTAAELTDFITSAVSEGATMKYLNPACPALVATDGVVRTENANTALSAVTTGSVIGAALSDLPAGVGAGVRCVRSGTDAAPLQTRFTFARADSANKDGRTLIDTQTSLEWINQTTLDENGDGCVSPGVVGPTAPDDTAGAGDANATSRCVGQTFAGHNDWRAPTGPELQQIIVDATAASGVVLKYLVAGCPANVSTNNFIRTENNGNPAVASTFPNATTGSILATLQSEMGTVPSGVRCVRDVTP